MATDPTAQKSPEIPPTIAIVVTITCAVVGIIPWLAGGHLPTWAIWTAVSFFVFVGLAVLWYISKGLRRFISAYMTRWRVNRENFTAVRGAMASLCDAVNLSHEGCVYRLHARLESDKIVRPESIIILAVHLRALLTWLLRERERLDRGLSDPLAAFDVSSTVLDSYVGACNVIANVLRGEAANRPIIDSTIRADWKQVTDYANGIVQEHRAIAGRINARLHTSEQRAYFASVQSLIES